MEHIFNNMEEYIFNNIDEYMLTAKNISRYTLAKCDTLAKCHTVAKCNTVSKCDTLAKCHTAEKCDTTNNHPMKPKEKETIFIPFQKDKLFWSFYIILNGFDTYEFIKNDSFKTEKTFKIQSIEKLREIKDKLKEHKIKRNEIENELVNTDTITLKGLEALCLIYDVSMLYVSGKKYHAFLFDTLQNIKGVIVHTKNNEYGVKHDVNDTYTNNIKETYWKIDNIGKPLRGISTYTIKDLQSIAEKLEISLIDTETVNKKKCKKQLYEEIIKKV